MNWVDAVLLIAAVLGLFLGSMLVVRHPAFWALMISAAVQAAIPQIKEYVSRRMTSKQEEELHQAVRRGQEWDNFNKRPRDK